jgi:hypothetical protein
MHTLKYINFKIKKIGNEWIKYLTQVCLKKMCIKKEWKYREMMKKMTTELINLINRDPMWKDE